MRVAAINFLTLSGWFNACPDHWEALKSDAAFQSPQPGSNHPRAPRNVAVTTKWNHRLRRRLSRVPEAGSCLSCYIAKPCQKIGRPDEADVVGRRSCPPDRARSDEQRCEQLGQLVVSPIDSGRNSIIRYIGPSHFFGPMIRRLQCEILDPLLKIRIIGLSWFSGQ